MDADWVDLYLIKNYFEVAYCPNVRLENHTDVGLQKAALIIVMNYPCANIRTILRNMS